MIVKSEGKALSDIMRDLKKFTSTKIVHAIRANGRESRKNWMLCFLTTTIKSGFGKKDIMPKKF
jgi:putative transposase